MAESVAFFADQDRLPADFFRQHAGEKVRDQHMAFQCRIGQRQIQCRQDDFKSNHLFRMSAYLFGQLAQNLLDRRFDNRRTEIVMIGVSRAKVTQPLRLQNFLRTEIKTAAVDRQRLDKKQPFRFRLAAEKRVEMRSVKAADGFDTPGKSQQLFKGNFVFPV